MQLYKLIVASQTTSWQQGLVDPCAHRRMAASQIDISLAFASGCMFLRLGFQPCREAMRACKVAFPTRRNRAHEIAHRSSNLVGCVETAALSNLAGFRGYPRQGPAHLKVQDLLGVAD